MHVDLLAYNMIISSHGAIKSDFWMTTTTMMMIELFLRVGCRVFEG